MKGIRLKKFNELKIRLNDRKSTGLSKQRHEERREEKSSEEENEHNENNLRDKESSNVRNLIKKIKNSDFKKKQTTLHPEAKNIKYKEKHRSIQK